MSLPLLGGGSGHGSGTGGGAGPTPGAEASAFIARTTALDTTHQNAYIDLINGLVADSIWSKLDCLWIFATQDATNAVLNLVSSSFNATANGSITFTADLGYTGSGADTTKYINSNFNPSTAGGQYTQNAAHISAWSVTTATVGNPIMGIVTGTGNGETMIRTKNPVGNAFEMRINSTGIDTVAIADSGGHSLVSRTASNAITGYRNGSSILTGTTTTTALANYNTTFDIIGEHNANNNTHTGAGQQVAMASIGGSLSSTDASNFYTRLRTFMTVVGVP